MNYKCCIIYIGIYTNTNDVTQNVGIGVSTQFAKDKIKQKQNKTHKNQNCCCLTDCYKGPRVKLWGKVGSNMHEMHHCVDLGEETTASGMGDGEEDKLSH